MTAKTYPVRSGRKTYLDETGQWARVCAGCGEEKKLKRAFHVSVRNEAGQPIKWQHYCKKCAGARQTAEARARRENPATAEAERQKRLRLKRQWRERNPEAYKAQCKSYRQRRAADPARYQAMLENQRIERRLWAERNGAKPVSNRIPMLAPRRELPRLPSRPLADFIEREMAGRALSLGDIAHMAGVPERTLRAWVKNERKTVQFDTADKILVALDALWFDVWPDQEEAA